MKAYLFLFMAIVAEIIATSTLKASEQFTRLWPSVVVTIGYAVSFYCLSQALRVLPVGIAYAIWSAAGIVLVSLVAFLVYRQHLDMPAVLGMGLIIAGVVVINLFSKSVPH